MTTQQRDGCPPPVPLTPKSANFYAPAVPLHRNRTHDRPRRSTKTVVVMGGAYGGNRGARMLAEGLPEGWRVVLIDRNTHMNHVYVFPRYTILSQHAPKGFIPRDNIFKNAPAPAAVTTAPKTPVPAAPTPTTLPTPPLTPPSSSSSEPLWPIDEPWEHQFIQGSITSLDSHSVTFVRPGPRLGCDQPDCSIGTTGPYGGFDGQEETIEFDYAIYALGSGLPDPVNVWTEHPNMPEGVGQTYMECGLGTKRGGVRWMERKAETMKKAQRILIVGGGALGIQFAGDLKELYPEKQITLLHSRPRLMPIYPIEMHVHIVEHLQKIGVELVLGERVMTWPEDPETLDGKTKTIRTDKGRVFEADIVLPCTGQKPHAAIMAALAPSSINPANGRIRVHPTLQVHQGPTVTRPPTSRANTLEKLSALSLHSTTPVTPPRSSATSSTSDDGEPDISNIFAVGDCADTGAIQAGHTAYWQSEVAARNILRLVDELDGKPREGPDGELEKYKSGPPAIKVTLGLKNGVIANGEGVKMNYEGVEDLQALVIWPSLNAQDLPIDA